MPSCSTSVSVSGDRVGAQHEHAVGPGVFVSLAAIDAEVTVAAGREATPKSVLPASAGSLRRNCRSSAARLAVRSARRDVSAAPLDNKRYEGRSMVRRHVARQSVAALAHAEDEEQVALLECGDRLGADYAAVGDDADQAGGEARRRRSITGKGW